MKTSRIQKMFKCQPFGGGGQKSTSLHTEEGLALSQKLSFACGHVLNDLVGSAWFSYLLVFLTKVSELSNPHAGYVILSSQIFEALWNPVVGRLCDRTVSRYGRRKLWHLVGTFCVTITVPMIFMRCISCEDEPSGTKMWYYIGLGICFCFGWGATQIGHLALIPEICRSKIDAIELSALRSAVTFLCGIFIYIVTWILLGQSNEESLSPNVWKQFMYLGFIIVGTGTFFNFLFHIWTDEPSIEDDVHQSKHIDENNSNKLSKNKSTKLKKPIKVSMKISCFSSKSLNSKTKASACTKTKGNTEESVSLTNKNTISESSSLEVIERDSSIGKRDRKLRDWLKDPSFYKTNILYMCSRWVVIISQAYLPLYLIETLQFEKESIAYFPLVVLISGVIASPSVGPLNKRFGSQIAFIVGCLLSIAASIWFFVQSIEGRIAVYMAAILIGCGGSIMLATSLSFIAELIGKNKSSGAFVYGTIGFTDKLSSGVVIAIIQILNPRPNGDRSDCPPCDRFVRQVLSFTPGCAALFGLLLVVFFFESVFTCKRKVRTSEIATQTEKIDIETERKSSHGVIPQVVINQENDVPINNPDSINDNHDSVVVHTSTARDATPSASDESKGHDEPSHLFHASDHDSILDNHLFVKRNFLSSSWCNLESQAAVRLACYEKTSPNIARRSFAV